MRFHKPILIRHDGVIANIGETITPEQLHGIFIIENDPDVIF